MNGHDFKNPDAEAASKARYEANRLALEIGADIVTLIETKHPHAHPAIVAQALASTMAAMVVLFARGDAEALAGAEAAYRALRTNVIGMMASKRKAEGS